MATKVRKTEVYKDSQGEHIVVKGKLVLLKSSGILPPIIISETEDIEVGDRYYTSPDNDIAVCNEHKIPAEYYQKKGLAFKILALPEQFSPKHLQAILDGKLNNGDEVYIKCEVDLNKIPTQFIEYIKLTNNHIKLFPVKKESEKLYSKTEILEKVNQWFREEASVNGLDAEPIDRWLSKNL